MGNAIRFVDLHPSAGDFAAEVLQGLSQAPKSIPPKYFYDAQGSKLFDAITELPEYYPTRTESAILSDNAEAIARALGQGVVLIEPGGGSCEKVGILLPSLQPRMFVPIDISREHLREAAKRTAQIYDWLPVCAVCSDFTGTVHLPDDLPDAPRVVFFPGSSIGNFAPDQAQRFLREMAKLLGVGGHLLIGVDTKKDPAVLQAAYDDAAGVTAKFNLNLLVRINRELAADFQLAQWSHQALYNEKQGRVEMHLRSLTEQTVTVAGRAFEFAAGETIHSENSYKYHPEEFQALAAGAGYASEAVWMDSNACFSVHLFRVR